LTRGEGGKSRRIRNRTEFEVVAVPHVHALGGIRNAESQH